MKTSARNQIAQGFAIIGSVGFLVASFVVPGQWQAGQIPAKAQIGLLDSALCVLLAAVAARTMVFGFTVLLSTVFIVSLGYLAVIPFVGAQVGWNTRVLVLVISLVVIAAVSAAGLWRLRIAAQPSIQPDRREDAAPG